MKKFYIKSNVLILLAIIPFFLLACGESARNLELRKKIAQHQANIKVLRENIQILKNELEGYCAQSLQYRFPQLKAIETGRMDVNFKDIDYVKAIRFSYKKPQKYSMVIDYKSDVKTNVHFAVLIFSGSGINIARHDVHHKGIVSYYLSAGEPKIGEEEVIVPGELKPNFILMLPLKE